MIVPKSQICAWSHHHQHAPTFLRSSLNRLLEFFHALHTGVATNLWVLHHNHGHHQHYPDQSKDNPYEASFNNLNKWYNMFTGNLGFCTAHHHNGGLHWSKLPQLHARLADKIPDRLIRRTWV